MSLAASSCYRLIPQVLWTQELGASSINTFSFPPQHRFLPCENKSKAVEQVKSTFSKVRNGGRRGLETVTSTRSPSWQVLSRPRPSLEGGVGTQQMV